MTRVWVSRSVRTAIEQEAHRMAPRETGGVLLGYWSEDGHEAVIAEVSGPGPKATHAATEFIPDDEYQDAVIDEAYSRSGRRHSYVGDWHTHPSGDEFLSVKDRRTLKRIALHAEPQTALMAVAIGNQTSWELAVWHFTQRRSFVDRWMRPAIVRCEVRAY